MSEWLVRLVRLLTNRCSACGRTLEGKHSPRSCLHCRKAGRRLCHWCGKTLNYAEAYGLGAYDTGDFLR
jgi:hypothetical protein